MQAWLNQKPEGSARTNSEVYNGELPEVDDDYAHLPEFLIELGFGSHSYGMAPISHQEIRAWSLNMNIPLTPFECKALKVMSIAYVSIVNDKKAACPIQTEEVQQTINDANIASWLAVCKRD